ncbi:hypothetical protein D3C78_1817270 [compost metagenome]
MPLCFMPPQGASTKVGCEQLTQTMPARSWLAMRVVRCGSALMTAAARPKRLALAICTAWSSVLKRLMHSTGPNTSSRQRMLLCPGSSKIAGSMK